MTETRKIEIPNSILFEHANELLSQGQNVVLKGKGESMLPFIRGGVDSILLESAKEEDLQIGDIVLARLDEKNYVVHRIIEFRADRVILMGDGNLVGVEECLKSSILAYVKKIIKPSGEIICRDKRARFQWKIWHSLRFLRRFLLAFYKRINHKIN